MKKETSQSGCHVTAGRGASALSSVSTTGGSQFPSSSEEFRTATDSFSGRLYLRFR